MLDEAMDEKEVFYPGVSARKQIPDWQRLRMEIG